MTVTTNPSKTGVAGRGNVGSTPAQETPTLGSELAVSTGWTSTNWTGDYASGFAHSTGNVSPLSQSVPITTATAYAIGFTISGRTAGQVEVAMGGVSSTGGSGHKFPDAVDGAYPTTAFFAGVTTADGTTALTFTPSSTFDGTISLISVKAITAPYESTESIVNSSGSVIAEARSTHATVGSTYYGYQAGQYSLDGAYYNTAFGYSALAFNTGGRQNTAVGYWAMLVNTSGVSNTAVGTTALKANTTGDQNTAVGVSALVANTSGFNNIAIGVESLKSNTTGSYNTSVGPYDTMFYNVTGSYNTAVGMLALQNNTASNNTAVGSNALQANTTGSTNTAVGFYALNVSQTGNHNTALGYQAGVAATTSDNTLIGSNAGVRVAGGTGSNTAVGSNALAFLSTGGYGTAVGAYAMNKTTGRTNLGVGYGAGFNLTTGRANIIIGNFVDAPSATTDGQINIGNVLYGKGAYDGGGSGAVSATASSTGAIGIGTSAITSTLTLNGSLARNIVTNTSATYSVLGTDTHIIANFAGVTTVTLPTAASFPGRELTLRTIQAQTVVSASSNVVPLVGGAAGTAILAGTAGKWALLVSDGTNWQVQNAN